MMAVFLSAVCNICWGSLRTQPFLPKPNHPETVNFPDCARRASSFKRPRQSMAGGRLKRDFRSVSFSMLGKPTLSFEE